MRYGWSARVALVLSRHHFLRRGGSSRGRDRTNIRVARSSGPILQLRNLDEQLIGPISQITVVVAVGQSANRLNARLPICGIANRLLQRKLIAVLRKDLQGILYMHQVSFNSSVTITHIYPCKRTVHNVAVAAALAHKVRSKVRREPCPVPPPEHGPTRETNRSREPTTQPSETLNSQFRAYQSSGLE